LWEPSTVVVVFLHAVPLEGRLRFPVIGLPPFFFHDETDSRSSFPFPRSASTIPPPDLISLASYCEEDAISLPRRRFFPSRKRENKVASKPPWLMNDSCFGGPLQFPSGFASVPFARDNLLEPSPTVPGLFARLPRAGFFLEKRRTRSHPVETPRPTPEIDLPELKDLRPAILNVSLALP